MSIAFHDQPVYIYLVIKRDGRGLFPASRNHNTPLSDSRYGLARFKILKCPSAKRLAIRWNNDDTDFY